jgi:ABC-2 type transport system permease protein
VLGQRDPDAKTVYARDDGGDLPIHLVSPRIGVFQRLSSIWKHRGLLFSLVGKEIRVKYKNSFLGFAWSMLNPAMYILIYYIVFQKILRNGIPLFAIYLSTGLLIWNMFQAGVQGGTGSIVGGAGLVKKVAFPREILALASVGAAFVFFLFQVVVLVIFLVIFRVAPALNYLWILPIGLLAILIIASALAVFLSAVNVYLRDMQHLVELLMLAWFWATPVVYTYLTLQVGLAHHGLTQLYLLNPVTPVVLLSQRALYAKLSPMGTNHQIVHVLPNFSPMWFLQAIGIELVVGAVLFLAALYVFSRLEGNFAEEL